MSRHQLTGCETVGNIQIQVIPRYRCLPNWWAGYSATATPRELGFSPGDCIPYKLPTLFAARGLWSWQLFVRIVNGDTLIVNVKGDPTVNELKCLLQEIEGTSKGWSTPESNCRKTSTFGRTTAYKKNLRFIKSTGFGAAVRVFLW